VDRLGLAGNFTVSLQLLGHIDAGVLHADTIMISFASGPVSRYRAIGLAVLLLAGGAASPAHAGGDTWDAREAALSYRDAVHGSAEAQADLGARYAEGRGFPQSLSPTTAIETIDEFGFVRPKRQNLAGLFLPQIVNAIRYKEP